MLNFFNHIFLLLVFWSVYIPGSILTGIFKVCRISNSRPQSNSVLYLAAFFAENAGYQYRVNKWAEIIRSQGCEVDIKAVFNKEEFEKLTERNHPLLYIKSFVLRFFQILQARKYKTVIVRRELCIFNDYGNLFLEKLLVSIHPFVILDFDDDIAYAKNEKREVNLFGKFMLESGEKFTKSLKLYQRFIVGSNYLKQYLLELNPKLSDNSVLVIPTCVDYHKSDKKEYNPNGMISFGWIGGNYNLKLLDKLIPSLNKLSKSHPINLKVISGKAYSADANFEIENLPWSIDTQIDQLKQIDIGLMPLNNTDEDKGKCGFKLIQYMGLGIVSIASGVTVNNEIIEDDRNGYLVADDEDWESVFQKVISKKDRFSEIGAKARKSIQDKYSFEANTKNYLSFIE
ncbi:MAG: glycosyltransferase family 4 protein [Chitinophagales bacterium]|nr:glycosyltransferase family 4 protein [Chitinophagales bacterium]